MIDLIDYFEEKLIYEEIGETTNLASPSVGPEASSNTELNNSDFPKVLNVIYRQVDNIEISWEISMRKSGEPIINILKQDSFLKENYWDEGYEWGVVHEYLSGFINIQKPEDMLNPEFCKDQHFYSTIEMYVKEENPDDFLPFDITWDLTACLKKEDGKILDNIWLVSANGRSMVNMEVSIEKYLELCYKAKGFHYWQLVYYMQDENYEYTQLMKRYLPVLFPHLELDLSDFGIENE